MVTEAFREAGLRPTERKTDLAGVVRVLACTA
jgi:hypothetical protein